MTTLNLQNNQLHVDVDINLGAEITRIANRGGDNLLFYADWKTPARASHSQSYGNQVFDWLSEYRGGWQELFPNAGGGGDVLGTPLPFHGEVSRTRWSYEWAEQGREVILTAPARLPLVIERRMRLDAALPVLYIEECITSEADFPVPYIWGHHPAWGPPLAESGAHIDLPARSLSVDAGLDGDTVDLMPGSTHQWGSVADRHGNPVDLSVIPAGPVQRLCYVEALEAGWYAVRNPKRGLGVALAWDLATFPNLWFWQEIGGGKGMPWYGRGKITALEPASQTPSYGLAAAIEAGTARYLGPQQEVRTQLTCVLFEADDRPVKQVNLAGQISY